MPLFIVEHQHAPETCPARDPRMGEMLLQHLSAANTASRGITIHGDAVADGAHHLYLIVEGPDETKVTEFMGPFAQIGSVTVMPASHCAAVVGRGGC